MSDDEEYRPDKDPFHQTTSNIGAQEQIARDIAEKLEEDLDKKPDPKKQEQLERITDKFPRTSVKDTGN